MIFYYLLNSSITYRNLGYSQGYADAQANAGEIEYVYHEHGDGYCTSVPIYHSHTSQTGACYTPTICSGKLIRQTGSDGEEDDDDWSRCNKCGQTAGYKDSGKTCGKTTGYTFVCTKTTNTIESYVCGLNESTIISASIKFIE